MSDIKQFIQMLFAEKQVPVPASHAALLDRFANDRQVIQAVNVIIENQALLMNKWKHETRIADIIRQPVRILNGTVGKPYETRIDFDKYKWKDISSFSIEGLEAAGLNFDSSTKQITGTPDKSGDIAITLKFKLAGQEADAPFNEKKMTLIINPDPKSLWKDIASNTDDPYWKKDNVTVLAPLGDRHILASSKRGRSHANTGAFREDDFSFTYLQETGWSIVVVADGAGSAKISRKGSAIACASVVDYFTTHLTAESLLEFDQLLQQYHTGGGEDTQQKLNRYVYGNLGKAALHVHKQLEAFAASASVPLHDLNTTLIFTLFKKYDIGYALLSFGVGDCPIGLVSRDLSEVTLMNWLDVGEFGGGTRFITMPEIFQTDKFATRFGFKLADDFSYLMMMTDGIYDPKFVVEASVANISKWKELLADLAGKNEDGISVELKADDPDITSRFSAWMDFWSPGNHDDRTLAIVF